MKLINMLENSDTILCPQSALELVEIYFECETGANMILQNQNKISISKELFINHVSSCITNMELIEEITNLDFINGGNLKRCMDAIKNNKNP